MQRVLPDSNVLLPVGLQNLFMRAQDAGFFHIVWSDVLVTHNIRDFLGVVRPRCSVLDPDNFFTALAREFPLEFVGIIQQTSTSLREARTSHEILEQLRASGLRQFHQLLEPYLAG